SVQINGAVRDDFVEIFLVWHTGGKDRVAPATAKQPRFLGVFCCVGLNALLGFGNGFCIIQINLLQEERAFHEVNVAVGKAGKDEAALGVDDLSIRSAITGNFVIGCDRENFALANSEGFGPRVRSVDGVDAAVEEDGVGGLLGGGVRREE